MSSASSQWQMEYFLTSWLCHVLVSSKHEKCVADDHEWWSGNKQPWLVCAGRLRRTLLKHGASANRWHRWHSHCCATTPDKNLKIGGGEPCCCAKFQSQIKNSVLAAVHCSGHMTEGPETYHCGQKPELNYRCFWRQKNARTSRL